MRSWQNRYGGFVDLHENYGNRKGIDWLDRTMGRTTVTQNYRVGVNGGNDKLNYNMSYGYFKDEGAMVYSGSDKHNIALSVKSEVNKRLSVTGRINFDYLKVYGAGVAGNGTNEGGSNVDAKFNKMVQILQYRPTIGIRGNDSDLLAGEDPVLSDADGNVMQNPLIAAAEEKDNKETRTLQANGGLTFKIIKGLTFRNNTGMRYQLYRRELFYGDQSIMGRRSGIYGSIRNTETGSFQTSNVLTYDKRFQKKHKVVVQLGQEFVKRWTRVLESGVSGLPTDEFILGDMSLGTPSVASSDDNYDDNLLSFFARLNYDFTDKYLFSATFRADGSSKFGKNNKWGYFPSAALGWRISEEDFMKDISWIQNLKLRASYGETGSQAITAYQSLASFSTTSYVLNGSSAVALVPGRVPNPDLKWETTKQTDIGIDLSVLGGRISLVADYYYKKTVDLHYDKILPYYTGYSSQTQNIGSKSNKGWEFSLNTQNLVGDFKWSTSLNIALNREKVLDLGDDEYFYTNGSGGALGAGFNETGIVKVGEPLGNFYGYVFDGIYQNEAEAKALGLTKDDVGSVKFKDLNGDNKITTEDRTIIGNANPDFIFGIGNDFSYKNFDLSFMFQGTYGNDVYNLLKVTFSELPSNSNNTGNAFAFVKDSWRGEGTSNTQQAFNKGVGPSSSRFVEDGSYIRLKNLTFGYTLPKSVTSKWGISNLRFYLSGQNLFTITGYSGYDPEVSSRTGNYNLGFDGGSYPATRSYTFGLNLTL